MIMMNNKEDLILLCISGIIGIFAILLIIYLLFSCACFGAETKQIKKSVSQSTSKENKTRKQMYNTCVQQTGSTSRCYYIYY